MSVRCFLNQKPGKGQPNFVGEITYRTIKPVAEFMKDGDVRMVKDMANILPYCQASFNPVKQLPIQ